MSTTNTSARTAPKRGTAIPIRRWIATSMSATPFCISPPSPTAKWRIGRTRTWKRKRASRWHIWPKRIAEFRTSFKDIQSQPRRFINSPMWSGLIENGRSYAPFTYNVEEGIPWRTLTGRQSFYLDHPVYIDFGEHLPTYKPKPMPTEYSDLQFTGEEVARR